jgi:hypothetical protein
MQRSPFIDAIPAGRLEVKWIRPKKAAKKRA